MAQALIGMRQMSGLEAAWRSCAVQALLEIVAQLKLRNSLGRAVWPKLCKHAPNVRLRRPLGRVVKFKL